MKTAKDLSPLLGRAPRLRNSTEQYKNTQSKVSHTPTASLRGKQHWIFKEKKSFKSLTTTYWFLCHVADWFLMTCSLKKDEVSPVASKVWRFCILNALEKACIKGNALLRQLTSITWKRLANTSLEHPDYLEKITSVSNICEDLNK